MGKPSWDQGYSGQTLEQLLALEEQYESWSLLFPLELAIQAKAERVGDANLSEEERIVLAIEALEPASLSTEDVNGAVAAYCEKEREQWVPQGRGTVLMRKESGSHETSHQKMWDALNQCDEDFFRAPEDIGGRLFTFVKSNRAHIQF